MPIRSAVLGVALTICVVGLAGCGGGGSSPSVPTTGAPPTTRATASTTTTPGERPGDDRNPVVIVPGQVDTRVRLGDVVVFSMGDPGDGEWFAASEDPLVIRITNSGRTVDGVTTDAAGRAVGVGETEVVLQYRGRDGESPDSQRFTITVSPAAR